MNRTIPSDPRPEHYGKFVLMKSFNDRTIVAYGETMEELRKSASAAGYKVTGKMGESRERVGVTMRLPHPCERFMGAVLMAYIIESEIKDECISVGKKCADCPYIT